MPKKRKDRKPDKSETHEWKCKVCGQKGPAASKEEAKVALYMHDLMTH